MVFTASFLPFVNGATSVAGEIKGGSKSFMRGVLLALVVSGILITMFIYVAVSSMGSDFFIGTAYLSTDQGVTAAGLANNPVFDAILLTNNPLLQIFLAIGSFLWYVAIMFAVAFFVSRYFMAISFDKSLPTIVSYVNDRFHSPVVAHLIDLGITISGLTIVTVTPLSQAFFYGIDTAGAMALLFGFLIVVLTALLGTIRGSTSLKGNRFLNFAVAVTDLVVLISIRLLLVWQLYHLSRHIHKPRDSVHYRVSFHRRSCNILYKRKYRMEKEGIDIADTFREIPPE